MSIKKISLIIILFILGLLLIIIGSVLMLTKNTGKKISAENFKEIITKDGCNISDEQKNKTGKIKRQLISMEYNCPYALAYIEFNDTSYQETYVESNVNKINYTNGNVTTKMDINILDYREVRTTGEAYNVLISKDNMVIIGSTPSEDKVELDNIINILGIRNQIAWENIWLVILGGLCTLTSVILLIVSLIQKERKKQLSK